MKKELPMPTKHEPMTIQGELTVGIFQNEGDTPKLGRVEITPGQDFPLPIKVVLDSPDPQVFYNLANAVTQIADELRAHPANAPFIGVHVAELIPNNNNNNDNNKEE